MRQSDLTSKFHFVGLFTPRGAQYEFDSGYTSRLPNPRLISAVFHAAPRNVTDPNHTHMFMQFGQFIDHDVAGFAKPGN